MKPFSGSILLIISTLAWVVMGQSVYGQVSGHVPALRRGSDRTLLSPVLRHARDTVGAAGCLDILIVQRDPVVPEEGSIAPSRHLRYVSVRCVTPAFLDSLAELDEGVAVELLRMPMEELRQPGLDFSLDGVTRVRTLFPTLRGGGQRVSIKERSMDHDDIDLKGRILETELTPSAITVHATNMATIIGGGGATDQTALGVAPEALLTSSDFAWLLPDNAAYFIEHAISIQNHSYGVGVENYYGIETQAYDQRAIDQPGVLHIFSAGNAGEQSPDSGRYAGIPGVANLTGQFKQAKHVLVVGGLDSVGLRLALGSAGPAYDGRVKPEVMAFGQGGTSGAAALVTGLALLVRESYLTAHGTPPSAEIIKAILIHTARDVGPPGPDYQYGFGRVQAPDAILAAMHGNILTGVVAGDTIVQPIMVDSAKTMFKATLLWTDPPAELMAEKALVHDLDCYLLEMTTGRRYHPLVLNSMPDSIDFPARPGVDTLNPVEQIVISDLPPGPYQLVISGRKTGAATQAFTLLWTIAQEEQFSWEFPVSADILTAGESTVLRWHTTLEEGNLAFRKTNEQQWQSVGQVDPATGTFSWRAPMESGLFTLGMEFGDTIFVSDPFLVAPVPDLNLVLQCPDENRLAWIEDPAAQEYQVFRLGDRYLEHIASVTGSPFSDVLPDTGNQCYSVRAVYDGLPGPQALAVQTANAKRGCYLEGFFLNRISDGRAVFQILLTEIEEIAAVTLQEVSADVWWDVAIQSPISDASFQMSSMELHAGAQEFRVLVTLYNGDVIESPVEVVYFSPQSAIVVYPNPATSGGQISVLFGTSGAAEFNIYDMMGRKCFAAPIEAVPQILNTNGWPPGVYSVVVHDPGSGVSASPFLIW